jgi:putative DNA primase/helicase
VYDAVVRGDLCAARVLGEHIRKGDLASPFGLREVYRPGWAGLAGRAAAATAVGVLVDLDWLRAEEVGTGPAGGRPTARYHVNPKVGGRA